MINGLYGAIGSYFISQYENDPRLRRTGDTGKNVCRQGRPVRAGYMAAFNRDILGISAIGIAHRVQRFALEQAEVLGIHQHHLRRERQAEKNPCKSERGRDAMTSHGLPIPLMQLLLHVK